MKLHKNSKRNKLNKLISLALVCCMTLSMGSSYVSAGEADAGVGNGGIEQQSSNNIEGNTFGEEQPTSTPEATQAPETTQEPETTQAPEATQTPEATQSPEATQEPVATQTPEATQEPEATQTPGASQEPETTQTPESTQAPGATQNSQTTEDVDGQTNQGQKTDNSISAQDGSTTGENGEPGTETGSEGSDIEGMPEDGEVISVEGNLDEVPANKAGAMTSFRSLSVSSPIPSGYSFDAYYVNQFDGYDVTMYDDFNLKYQMEFHASDEFEPGTVVIKINAELFKDRNGNSVVPSEIGIPEGTAENPVPNRSTPFNYYYEDDGKTLVFFNYKKIASGTNAAWQVLYRDQKLMNIVDETEWELKPQISVDGGKGGTFSPAQALMGMADSWVALESVNKSYYTESGLNYTPGLYTLSQVKRYISGEVDDKFLNDAGRLDTANWRFVVWDVKVKGTATQPWHMIVRDIPGNEGEVVGYKDNSDRATAYKLPIGTTEITASGEGTVLNALENQKEDSWGNRFYVVTAYPAAEIQDGDKVSNVITIDLVPADGKDEHEPLPSQTATWNYKDYDWTYSGNVIGINKETDDTEYTGWLDAYRLSKVKGEDYGDMPFTTTGHMYGYSYTHRTDNGSEGDLPYNIGDYRPGTYYTLTTADDFVYLYAGSGDAVIMDQDDYYFSGVTVTQKDYGYDVWEDERTDSELTKVKAESLPDVFKQENSEVKSEVRIYAMLANPSEKNNEAEAEDGWVLIDTVYMDAAGLMEPYVFSEDIIAQEPWRVKAEHDTIDFETVCTIDVKVRIKADSPKMQAIVDERNNAETNEKSPRVGFENISGVFGQVHQGSTMFYCTEIDGNHGSSNYGEPGLEEATKALYQDEDGSGILLIRDNAYRYVTWLNETAAAFKNAKSTNDVNNNRVLVDYYLTAYDGYEIYDRESLNYLREEDQDLISPGRSHVVFYDLLPYGMQFDASAPITAGRITNLSNDTYQKQPKSWDSTQVTVTVDPEKDIITDYRGTGRTMVAFHIAFGGADSTSYTARKWIEGWGVSFRAYYDWKDIDQLNKVEINANLCAFMPDFSELAGGSNLDHPALVGLKTEVDFDNGTHGDKGDDLSVVASAYADMVKEYTDENGQPVKGNIDGYTLEDKDGKPFDSNYRNVLYAKNVLKDDVATSSQSAIEKLVRADSDRFGTFDKSAVVPVGEGKDGFYTYDITVTTATGIKDIVIFDRLEQAVVDRKGTNDPFAGEFTDSLITWSGTFRSLDTTALDKQGISYTVYYSKNPQAPISLGSEDPTGILTSENGWYDEEGFKNMLATKGSNVAEDSNVAGTWQNYVKAIALRLDNKNGGTYQLDAGSSVSFRIKMRAPMVEELKENSSLVTYNNPSFSSVAINTSTAEDINRSTVTGNSVKVTISNEERMEIIKETSGIVPAARQDEDFQFRLFEQYEYDGETVEQYLSYMEYKFYKLSGDNWVLQDGLHATDGNGYLYLHAGEKAVFEVADAGRIQVEETENVFWESKIAEKETQDPEDGIDIRTLTVTNTYRPVLYMWKNLSAVPEGMDVSQESFTFKVEIKRNNIYVPLANAEFWYVDSIRLDGGVPGKISSGITGEDGTFTIRKDDIVALFPGVAGTEYRVSEIIGTAGNEENQILWDWVCEQDQVTGTIAAGGDSRSITNYYRWKDLLLTKDITHQSQEDYDKAPQLFTFSISEVGKGGNGEEILTPVVGKEWELLGDPVSGNAGTADESGNANAGTTGEAGNGNTGTENGSVPEEETYRTSGVLDENGKFTCAMGFRTVRIKGLEAGKTYRITELTEGIGQVNGKPLYVPADNGSATATMPVYSTRRDVTITNDYQKRPLSVKKTVVGSSDSGGSGYEEKTVYFRFTATVNNIPIPQGTPYTVTRTGSAEKVTRFVGVMPEGEDYSFASADVSGLGLNQFILADGETAEFKDAGMLGDEVTVTEVDNANQIYPALTEEGGVYKNTLSEDGAEASFVNGEPGSLMIGKEYVGLDEIGNYAVEDLKDYLMWGEGNYYEGDGSVQVVLEITDEEGTYVWPEAPVTVLKINRFGLPQEEYFEPGDSITLCPFETIIIPTGEGTGIPSDANYTLIETEESRKRIVQYYHTYDVNDDGMSYSKTEHYWMQVSQSAASDILAKPETVSARPSAVICNEVKSIGETHNGSLHGKVMTATSEEVPEGKKLVWRVERYDKESGSWFPAEKINYVILNGGEMVSREVESTKEDGRITLYKLNYGLPGVWFPEDQVYLNLYVQGYISMLLYQTEEGKDLLRLVEVPEESDVEWGLLVGYQSGGLIQGGSGNHAGSGVLSQANQSTQLRKMAVRPGAEIQESQLQYGMDVPPMFARNFVNSNSKTAVEIEKYMKTGSDSLFTMILEQVISTSFMEPDMTITKDNYQNTIVATRPGSGIPYTVHNADGSAAGSGVTGSGGELQLEAGQYVSLEVPDGTMWTVSEKTSASPNYRLTDLQPESGDGRLTKLNENLMLINLPVKVVPVQYTVEWYSYDGTLLDSETRVGNLGEMVSVKDEDKKYGSGGYLFLEEDYRNIESQVLEADSDNRLRLYFTKPAKYTVTWYVDGNKAKEETRDAKVGDWVEVLEDDTSPSMVDLDMETYGFDANNSVTCAIVENAEGTELKLYFVKKVSYTVKREYWLNGYMKATVSSKFDAVLGAWIVGEELSERNPAWNNKRVDGRTYYFDYVGSNPDPALIVNESTEKNMITLYYECHTD